VFFELVGPLALRYAAIHSGEVKILNLLPDRIRESLGASIVDTLSKLRRSLGLPSIGRGSSREIHAVDLMRRNFVPIRGEMSVDEVIHTVASEPFDQFPVVDEHDVFQGVISYPAIRDLLFSDELAHETASEALQIGEGVTCTPEAPLSEIIGIFEECHGEITHMLVVTAEEPRHVIGVIEQRDALGAFHKQR